MEDAGAVVRVQGVELPGRAVQVRVRVPGLHGHPDVRGDALLDAVQVEQEGGVVVPRRPPPAAVRDDVRTGGRPAPEHVRRARAARDDEDEGEDDERHGGPAVGPSGAGGTALPLTDALRLLDKGGRRLLPRVDLREVGRDVLEPNLHAAGRARLHRHFGTPKHPPHKNVSIRTRGGDAPDGGRPTRYHPPATPWNSRVKTKYPAGVRPKGRR